MRKIKNVVVDFLEVVAISFSIFAFVYYFLIQPHKIKGDSMLPTFTNGEQILTSKINYRLNLPQRYDVIIFKAPGTSGDEYIKRIIGLPGEKVLIKNGKVYINGKQLKENYLPENTYTNPGQFLSEGKTITIPIDNYFVLGDNRAHSSDSRIWGFVTKKKITGNAWIVYWPPTKYRIIN